MILYNHSKEHKTNLNQEEKTMTEAINKLMEKGYSEPEARAEFNNQISQKMLLSKCQGFNCLVEVGYFSKYLSVLRLVQRQKCGSVN